VVEENPAVTAVIVGAVAELVAVHPDLGGFADRELFLHPIDFELKAVAHLRFPVEFEGGVKIVRVTEGADAVLHLSVLLWLYCNITLSAEK